MKEGNIFMDVVNVMVIILDQNVNMWENVFKVNYKKVFVYVIMVMKGIIAIKLYVIMVIRVIIFQNVFNILDKTNNLESCICPPRHRGTFCDECLLKEDSLLSNVYIIPYPNCTIETISQRARISREKTDNRIYSRLIILLVTISLIIFFAIIMLIMHWDRNRDIDPNLNLAEKIERTKMLESAIFQSNGVQENRRYFNL